MEKLLSNQRPALRIGVEGEDARTHSGIRPAILAVAWCSRNVRGATSSRALNINCCTKAPFEKRKRRTNDSARFDDAQNQIQESGLQMAHAVSIYVSRYGLGYEFTVDGNHAWNLPSDPFVRQRWTPIRGQGVVSLGDDFSREIHGRNAL
jgi:hypothetical protein